jgi:aminoglycoside phosphotransferase (APT) family kinase protein
MAEDTLRPPAGKARGPRPDRSTGGGQAIVGETLLALRTDLELRIVPNLTDADALRSAQMIDGLLSYLAMWHLDLPAEVPALAAGRARLAGADAGAATLAGDLPVGGEAYGAAAAALQAKIEAADRLDPKLAAAVAQLDRQLYRHEHELAEAGARAAAERLAAAETEVTPALASQLLEHCFGPGYEVRQVTRAPGGFSKDTVFLGVEEPDGSPAEVVVRRDLPYGPAETKVRDEYRLLVPLAERDLPIAKPLALDRSAILGQMAMISRRVPGVSGTGRWSEDDAERHVVCRDLAAILARLHAIRPDEIGLEGYSADPREQLKAYVLEWRDRWRRNRVHPSPTLAAAFAWLLENIPERIERLSIVHGDVGFHNAIVDDGRVAALLDWEFFHLGDAAEDLSYCRLMIEPMIDWDDFMDSYHKAGGLEYRAENAAYFELWRSVRNAVTCATAWRGFLSGAYPALKMAYQGISLYRLIVQNVAVTLAELQR